MPEPTPAVTATDPRTAMLDVAERLIAARGVEGVSLREIGAAAGNRNNSAAQYHFGSKQGLLVAIFERRMAPVNERRLELLATVGERDVRGIVDAWVRPFAEAVLVSPPTGYAGFCDQVLTHPSFESFRLEGHVVTMGLQTATERLARSLDDQPGDLPRDVVGFRLHLAGISFVRVLADHERLLADGAPVPDVDDVVSTVVDALTGLLTAPVSERTSR